MCVCYVITGLEILFQKRLCYQIFCDGDGLALKFVVAEIVRVVYVQVAT